MIKTMFMYFCE